MSPAPLTSTGEPRIIANRYELTEERGRGPRTALFAAHDHALSRRVLVRIYLADASDVDRLRQQEAEVQRLASLEHPALTRLFDAGVDIQPDGRPAIFLVSDHNDGLDLPAAIANEPLSPVDVAELGADLSDALAVLHARGRTHGRVIPTNILVRPAVDGDRPQATLIDVEAGFVAHALPGVSVDDRPLSPADPLAAGFSEPASAEQDVYALGYCLALALRGSPPTFHDDGRLRVGVMDARRLGEILRHMMHPSPSARPTASAAQAALRDYLMSEIPVTTPIRIQNGVGASSVDPTDVLTSEPDELFTRITRLASSLTGSPISVLSFIRDDVATPRGATGVEIELGVPMHGALCAMTAQRTTPWAVADIWGDPRTRHVTPPLTADQVTSYAAAPLVTHDGRSIGSLCVFSAEGRDYGEDDLAHLAELAAIAVRDVELSATGRRSRELFR